MGEQEDNCKGMHTTRAPRKRSCALESKQLLGTKKRVVLAELTNSPNIVVSTQKSTNLGSRKNKPKCKIKKNNQEGLVAKQGIITSSDDTYEKCPYASCIYKHVRFLEMEERKRPLLNYIEKIQNDITATMREVLVDWLVDVAEEYKLVSDTLHLTVSYIDRFLSVHALSRKKLQLLGVSCMLVASKYEEIGPPHVEDFCYITDNTYTKEEVVNMERDILKFLDFEISTPTAKTFLRIFTRSVQENYKSPNLQFEFLACYLADLSLLDYRAVQFLPSVVAASAIFLSRFTIHPKMHPWSLALQQISGYVPSELKECVLAIHDMQLSRRGTCLRAVRERYMQHKFKCVAALSSPSEIPADYFQAVNE